MRTLRTTAMNVSCLNECNACIMYSRITQKSHMFKLFGYPAASENTTHCQNSSERVPTFNSKCRNSALRLQSFAVVWASAHCKTGTRPTSSLAINERPTSTLWAFRGLQRSNVWWSWKAASKIVCVLIPFNTCSRVGVRYGSQTVSAENAERKVISNSGPSVISYFFLKIFTFTYKQLSLIEQAKVSKKFIALWCFSPSRV